MFWVWNPAQHRLMGQRYSMPASPVLQNETRDLEKAAGEMASAASRLVEMERNIVSMTQDGVRPVPCWLDHLKKALIVSCCARETFLVLLCRIAVFTLSHI